MYRNRKLMVALLSALMVMVLVAPAMGVETTVTGLVKDTFELEADDGMVYLIDETDTGFDLVAHAGKMMQVTGEVTEEDGMKIISVTSFQPK